jgi:hypothetical protein
MEYNVLIVGASLVNFIQIIFFWGLVRVLSLLEVEEEEPTMDLSSLITTLQQELSFESIFS